VTYRPLDTVTQWAARPLRQADLCPAAHPVEVLCNPPVAGAGGGPADLSQSPGTDRPWGSITGHLLKLRPDRELGTEHETSFHSPPLQHTYPCPTCTLYIKSVGNTLKNTAVVLATL